MRDVQILLGHLGNINPYLDSFSTAIEKAAQFEYLISELFAYILHLNFYDRTHDNVTEPNRITWNGDITPIAKAPQGIDTIARCHGFWLIIEPTQRTNATQWTQEFAQAIRHCDEICTQHHKNPQDVLCILAVTSIHLDTYNSVKHRPTRNPKVIPLTTSHLEKILRITLLPYTTTHLEFRGLLNKISESITDSSSLDDFSIRADTQIDEWKKRYLKGEKNAFIAIKLYEKIKNLGDQTTFIISEVYTQLRDDSEVDTYFREMGGMLGADDVEKVLTQLGLAYYHSKNIQSEESIFEKIPPEDIKAKISIILSKIN